MQNSIIKNSKVAANNRRYNLAESMMKNEYLKPLMAVEKFVSNEYCAPCNWQGEYTSSGYIYDNSKNKLYYDENDSGCFENGEQVNTPTPTSKIFTFSYSDNYELGYVNTNSITGNIYLKNLIPASHSYYTYHSGTRKEYKNERTSLYALKADDGKTYWFSGNSFTFSKLRS